MKNNFLCLDICRNKRFGEVPICPENALFTLQSDGLDNNEANKNKGRPTSTLLL